MHEAQHCNDACVYVLGQRTAVVLQVVPQETVQANITDLFKNRRMAVVTLIVFFTWFIIYFSYLFRTQNLYVAGVTWILGWSRQCPITVCLGTRPLYQAMCMPIL